MPFAIFYSGMMMTELTLKSDKFGRFILPEGTQFLACDESIMLSHQGGSLLIADIGPDCALKITPKAANRIVVE